MLSQKRLLNPKQDLVKKTGKKRLPVVGFHYLTALLVFCITVDYRLPGSLTLVEILSYTLIALYAINALLTNGKLHQIILNTYSENRVVFLYFFWVVIDAIMAVAFREYPRYNISFLRNLIPSIVVYFLIVSTIKDKKRLQLLVSLYLLGIIINVFIGASQALTGWPEIVPGNWAVSFKMDSSGAVITGNVVRGFFTHPNAFAGFFIPGTMLLLTAIFRGLYNKRALNVLFDMLLLTCLLITIKFTYAKGAMFWMVLGSAFLFLPRLPSTWRLRLGVFAVTGSIIALTIHGLAETAKSGGALGTIQTRVNLWQAALAAMQEDNYIILFGNGNPTVLKLSNIYSNLLYANAHNGVLNQAVFYGILGLIFYLWIIVSSLNKLAKLIENERGFTRSTALFIFSSLIAMLGNSFFEPFGEGVPLQAQLFFLIALTTVMSRPTFDEVDI